MSTASVRSFFDGQRYKIIFIGDCGVGKTSLFWRYLKNQEFGQQRVTIVDFGYKTLKLDQRQVKLCVWDTAGQQKFRSIVATYFKSCQGVVMVFDVTKPQTWQNVKQVWYPMASSRVPNSFFMLFGNKSDLDKEMDLSEVRAWCAQKNVYFVQTSAKTGKGVQSAMFTLAVLIDNKKQTSQVGSSFACVPSGKTLGTRLNSLNTCEEIEFRMMDTRSFYLSPDDQAYRRNCC